MLRAQPEKLGERPDRSAASASSAGTLDRAPLITGQGAGLWRGPGHSSPMSGSMLKARSMSLAAFTAGPAFSAVMTISQSLAASGRRMF